MAFHIIRVFADGEGETHLDSIGLTEVSSDRGRSISLAGVPTTTLAITEMLEKRPPWGLHPAPRRQLLVVLQGEFEITTSGGQRRRFHAGECVLVDDLDSKGHGFEDVGDDPLITLQVGIDSDWHTPGSDEFLT